MSPPRYVFECGQIKINIFSASCEDSAWNMLKEKINEANNLDVLLPSYKEFNLLTSSPP